jgi:hypothetical protein
VLKSKLYVSHRRAFELDRIANVLKNAHTWKFIEKNGKANVIE